MRPNTDILALIEMLREGRPEEAIPHLEYLVDQMPAHVAAHTLLAQAYTMAKRWHEAKSSWQDASFLMPNSPSIQEGFRHILRTLAQQQDAQQTAFSTEATDDSLENNEVPEVEDETPQAESPLASQPEAASPPDTSPLEQKEATIPEISFESIEDLSALENPFSALDEASTPEFPLDVLEDSLSTDASYSEDHTPSLFVSSPDAHTDETQLEPEPEAELPPLHEAILNIKDSSEAEAIPAEPNSETPPPINGANIASPILSQFQEAVPEWSEDEELDHLIQELETARIVPKPDHESIDPPELEQDIEDMVSETLARILEGQKQYEEAASMFDKLALIHPDRSEEFNTKASELRAITPNESDPVQLPSPDDN